MPAAPIGVVIGSSSVVAVVPDNGGVRIAIEPIADQNRVGDAVKALALKNGLQGRQAVAALPTRLCAAGVRVFPSSMSLRDRIANVKLAPEDARFAGYASDERAVVGAPLDPERTYIGVAGEQTLEQYVEWLKAGRLRPLRLVSEAIGWKEALGDRYDGVVLPDVRSGTVVLFHGDYPQAEFFSTNERGAWYDHAATYVGQLRAASKGTLSMQRLALSEAQTDQMVKTLRERLQCDILEVPTLANPVTGAKEAAPPWLLPYGLARIANDPLDFLRALKEYRVGRFLEDRRQTLTFIGAAVAIAVAAILFLRAADTASYQTALAEKTVAQAKLRDQDRLVALQELKLGGIYGNIDPFLPTLLTVRTSGELIARCYSNFGNLIAAPAWLEEFDVAAPPLSKAPSLEEVLDANSTSTACVFSAQVDTNTDSLAASASLVKTLASSGIDVRLTSVGEKKDTPGVTELVFGTLQTQGGASQ